MALHLPRGIQPQMVRVPKSMGSLQRVAVVVCLLGAGALRSGSQQVTPDAGDELYLPPGTAVPVMIRQTLKSLHARAGDAVDAVTLQEVEVNGTSVLLKGTRVVGHVVESHGILGGIPSVLAIRFDGIETRGRIVPVHLTLRALADHTSTLDASTPHFYDDRDTVGRFDLVGGDMFLRDDPKVVDHAAEVVGYHLGEGVYGRLRAAAAGELRCGATRGEESLAVFSPDACGLYGFPGVSAEPAPGASLTIVSRMHDVRIYAYSAALLQVVE
jgi:hypothetical protein